MVLSHVDATLAMKVKNLECLRDRLAAHAPFSLNGKLARASRFINARTSLSWTSVSLKSVMEIVRMVDRA